MGELLKSVLISSLAPGAEAKYSPLPTVFTLIHSCPAASGADFLKSFQLTAIYVSLIPAFDKSVLEPQLVLFTAFSV